MSSHITVGCHTHTHAAARAIAAPARASRTATESMRCTVAPSALADDPSACARL